MADHFNNVFQRALSFLDNLYSPYLLIGFQGVIKYYADLSSFIMTR